MPIRLIVIIIMSFMISCNHINELDSSQLHEIFKQVLAQKSKFSDQHILEDLIIIYPDKSDEHLNIIDVKIEEIGYIVINEKMISSKNLTKYHVIFTDNNSLIVSRDISMDCGEEVCGIIEHYYFKKVHNQWEFERWRRVAQT